MICKYAEIFCWKNVSSFCSAKATHSFSAKNIRILYIDSAKTVNEMTLNELVKLTTLWTTGLRTFFQVHITPSHKRIGSYIIGILRVWHYSYLLTDRLNKMSLLFYVSYLFCIFIGEIKMSKGHACNIPTSLIAPSGYWSTLQNFSRQHSFIFFFKRN